jgi:hypothetical protein
MTAGPDEVRRSDPYHRSVHEAHDSARVVPILGSTDFAIKSLFTLAIEEPFY